MEKNTNKSKISLQLSVKWKKMAGLIQNFALFSVTTLLKKYFIYSNIILLGNDFLSYIIALVDDFILIFHIFKAIKLDQQTMSI